MAITGNHCYKWRYLFLCGFISYRRFKHLFLIAIIISTFLLFLNVKRSTDSRYLKFLCVNMNLTEDDNYCSDSYENTESFTIQTEGCNIPFLKPFDPKIKQYVEYPDIPTSCDTHSILEHNRTHIWIKNNQNFSNYIEEMLCCYRAFYRPRTISVDEIVDERVIYEECIDFNDVIDVNDEFVKINCSTGNRTFEDYFLFAPKKKFTVHNDIDEISSDETAYNILILGIDSVSRLNFYRTMPKTVKFLLDNDAVDLSGYNKVGDNTFPNLIPMLLGISESELKMTCLPHKDAKFDNCPFIWEMYKQAGYYTALGEDNSWLGTFNYHRPGFTSPPTDYYTYSFIHEAEKYAAGDDFYQEMALCLNDKYFYQVLLNYIHDITLTLRDKKLFGFFWEVTISHSYLNYPMIMDDDYLALFQKLKMSGYLNTSIVLVLSDHGLRWGDIRFTKQGRLEEHLPFVFVMVPQSFKEKHSAAFRNLQINSKRLTTPYDIYSTLYDLTNLDNVKNKNILQRSGQFYSNSRNISLFLPIPGNRTCELAGISDHWCTCHGRFLISTKSKKVWRAGRNLVERLNTRLSKYDRCAKLSLTDVVEANEMVLANKEINGDGWRELVLVIKTKPGNGVFEATLRGDNHLGWTIVGTVSRLNLYGNHSDCITDNLLKLYCYCQ